VPKIKSAQKSLRKSRQQRLRNQSIESRSKTAVRAARSAIAAGTPQVERLTRVAQRILDRAVSKGVLHRNTAARKKSRLARRARKAQAAPGPPGAA
jgi:small subunit ribosomal protein S20